MLARCLSSFAEQPAANHASGRYRSTLCQDRENAAECTQCYSVLSLRGFCDADAVLTWRNSDFIRSS
jgi:hypothetical protein